MTATTSATTPAALDDDLVSRALAEDPATWQPWLAASLAERVEDALCGSKAQLAELSDLLVQRLQGALRSARPTLMDALRGEGSPELRAAYQLGQLAFAQLLVAQALGHRADDDFVDVLLGVRHAPLVQQLAQHDDLSVEALTACGLDAAEVRLRLRELVSKGACDFRVLGGQARYFLTHVAKSALRVDPLG